MSKIVVEPDYVFVSIPKEWLQFYYKLIAAIAQHGMDEIDEAQTKSCKDRPTNLANCYNMFNAAIAAKMLNNTKLANLIIQYIEAKVDMLYSDIDVPIYEELGYEFTYMDIPADYIFTYHAMLKSLIEYGKKMLYDCKVACGSDIAKIIDCFNLFNTTLIVKRKGNDELAERLLNEANERLKYFLPNRNIYYDFSFFADNYGQLEVFVTYEDEKPVYRIKEEDQDLYDEIFKSNVFPLIFDFVFGT